jgi:choice-of-anchor C domain-containing protein
MSRKQFERLHFNVPGRVLQIFNQLKHSVLVRSTNYKLMSSVVNTNRNYSKRFYLQQSCSQFYRNLVLSTLPLACITLLPTTARATQLIANSDFEFTYPNLSPTLTYSKGNNVGGWIVESGDIDQRNTWEASKGQYSIDLNGNKPGSIFQDFATEKGKNYTLSFDLAGNPRTGNSPLMKKMQIFWEETLVDTLSFDTTGRAANSMGWANYKYNLLASNNTTRLRFTSLTDGNQGAILDNITVNPIANSSVPSTSVPEPTAILGLFTISFIGINLKLGRELHKT